MVSLVNFYSYCGCAGDLQEMLVAVSSTGTKEYTLYTRVGLFSGISKKLAKKRLLKKLKTKTGNIHREIKTSV
jgi:hypothetical protein